MKTNYTPVCYSLYDLWQGNTAGTILSAQEATQGSLGWYQ